MLHPIVLVVKSDEKQFQQLKILLELNQYRLFETSQGSNLSVHFAHRNPDLVIVCSANMSNGDGLKTVAAIRRQDRNVPIILLTKYSSEARVIAALRAGVNDYLKLPYSDKSLLTSIARLLPGSAALER